MPARNGDRTARDDHDGRKALAEHVPRNDYSEPKITYLKDTGKGLDRSAMTPGNSVSRLIKILHIDPDYQVTYLIYRHRSSIRTSVPLETAIELLKKEDFDLIVSEPHDQAILKKQPRLVEPKPVSADDQPFCEPDQGDFSEVRPNR